MTQVDQGGGHLKGGVTFLGGKVTARGKKRCQAEQGAQSGGALDILGVLAGGGVRVAAKWRDSECDSSEAPHYLCDLEIL